MEIDDDACINFNDFLCNKSGCLHRTMKFAAARDRPTISIKASNVPLMVWMASKNGQEWVCKGSE